MCDGEYRPLRVPAIFVGLSDARYRYDEILTFLLAFGRIMSWGIASA